MQTIVIKKWNWHVHEDNKAELIHWAGPKKYQSQQVFVFATGWMWFVSLDDQSFSWWLTCVCILNRYSQSPCQILYCCFTSCKWNWIGPSRKWLSKWGWTGYFYILSWKLMEWHVSSFRHDHVHLGVSLYNMCATCSLETACLSGLETLRSRLGMEAWQSQTKYQWSFKDPVNANIEL